MPWRVPHPSFAFSAKEGGDFDFPISPYHPPSFPKLLKLRPHPRADRKQLHRFVLSKLLHRKQIPRLHRHHVRHQQIDLACSTHARRISVRVKRVSPILVGPMRGLHLHPQQLSPVVHNQVISRTLAPRLRHPPPQSCRLRQSRRNVEKTFRDALCVLGGLSPRTQRSKALSQGQV